MAEKHYLLKMTDSVGTETYKVYHSFSESKQGFLDLLAEWAPFDASFVKERFFRGDTNVSENSTVERTLLEDEDGLSFTYDFGVERNESEEHLDFHMCSSPNGSCGCGCGSSYEINACIIHVE